MNELTTILTIITLIYTSILAFKATIKIIRKLRRVSIKREIDYLKHYWEHRKRQESDRKTIEEVAERDKDRKRFIEVGRRLERMLHTSN